MDNFSKNIGKKIALARKELGMSQSELAAHCSITQQCLSGYERGTRLIPLKVFKNICVFLNAPLSWFLPDIQQYGEVISEADVEFLREVRRYTEPETILDFLKKVKLKQSNGKKQHCLMVTTSAK